MHDHIFYIQSIIVAINSQFLSFMRNHYFDFEFEFYVSFDNIDIKLIYYN